MSFAKDIEQGIEQDIDFAEVPQLPPGDLESQEPPLESDLHLRQILLLISCLEWLWTDRQDFFASGNLTIYFSPRQIKSQDFRGPDFFVVLDTERRSRKSWVVWQEDGKYPNVIIEILSSSTTAKDKGIKKRVYQNTFRTPEYFWFDPVTLELAGFLLVGGVYRSIEFNDLGYLWSQQLELYLGVHTDGTLRYFNTDGTLVHSPQEAAILAQQQVELAQQQAETDRQEKEAMRDRLTQLEEKLRTAGIDPD